MTVALLRTQRTPADLAAMDGRELFAYAVDTGLIDPSSVAAVELGSVRIAGERAIVQVVVRGTPSPIDYELVRDDGRWLFDLVSTLEVGNTALLQVVQQSGVSEDQFIFESVERATGQRIDRAIFARP